MNTANSSDARSDLTSAVSDYRRTGDVPVLLGRLDAIARGHSSADLIAALAPFMELHEVAGPVYEVIVEREPANAKALVALANAYWLTGRGPDAVAELAERARTADPSNRGAWHLWALAESSPRDRTEKWGKVVERFPDDDLARANLADNAASLAGAENDPVAMKLAIANYEELLSRATRDEQRTALTKALETLRNWRV
jgi:tetratricopeptide (TPR) repeat protein